MYRKYWRDNKTTNIGIKIMIMIMIMMYCKNNKNYKKSKVIMIDKWIDTFFGIQKWQKNTEEKIRR